MDKLELKTVSREITGKKVKALRNQGIVPLHLYGGKRPSLSLQAEMSTTDKVLRMAGSTRLVDLLVDHDEKGRKVLVREVQRDYLSGKPLHVDFYEVSMKEKIKVEVPVALVGEAPALKDRKAVMVENIRSIEVECLPDRIPQKVEVDITSLAQIGDAVHVSDIKLGEGITILVSAEEVVVKVEGRKEEVEKPVVPVEAEVKEAAEEKPVEEETKE